MQKYFHKRTKQYKKSHTSQSLPEVPVKSVGGGGRGQSDAHQRQRCELHKDHVYDDHVTTWVSSQLPHLSMVGWEVPVAVWVGDGWGWPVGQGINGVHLIYKQEWESL